MRLYSATINPIIPPNKVYNESKSISSTTAFIEDVSIETKEPSENKDDLIVKEVNDLICHMNLKKDKYRDTKAIIEAIKNYKDGDIRSVKRELLTRLRSPDYNYIRQCGTFGYFTRYRTYENNQETSASWNNIETLLLSIDALEDPHVQGNLEKMMTSSHGLSKST